ncbi:hypothetical protein JTE90_001736 [Oedothorax gibbosus]|uniref:S1 motif domain-containing protein n=1 Tax=Oedothorax gibbosus TaxID=931172 RepID=A0AAV6V5I9_9ARAC|nr:hypothetical protein JTE90_001736 [Oedothorax gibbosus]
MGGIDHPLYLYRKVDPSPYCSIIRCGVDSYSFLLTPQEVVFSSRKLKGLLTELFDCESSTMKFRVPLSRFLSSSSSLVPAEVAQQYARTRKSMLLQLSRSLESIRSSIQITDHSKKILEDFVKKCQLQVSTLEAYRSNLSNSLQIPSYFERLGELSKYRVSVQIVKPVEVEETVQQKEAEVILPKPRSKLLDPEPIRQEEYQIFEKLEVPIHRIPRFYGLGEFNTKKFTDETGLELTLLENGTFCVIPRSSENMAAAKETIEKLLNKEEDPELEYNGIYKARIAEVRDSGIMVKLYPTMEPALIGNAQLDYGIVHRRKAQSLGLKAGQEIEVRYLGRDPATGNMKLTRRIATLQHV